MSSIVVKISGKILSPSNTRLVAGYVNVLRRLAREGYRVVIVAGGGGIAREYINAARALGVDRGLQDLLGIEAARLNARLLAYALWPDSYPEPPRSLYDVLTALSSSRIVVVGGFQPGQSTAGVAAIIAEAIKAKRLVLATTVDGVYDRDPRRHPDAKLLEDLTYDTLVKVLEQSVEPGRYELLDPLAIMVLRRSCVETIVVNGFDPIRVYKAIHGERIGSRIHC